MPYNIKDFDTIVKNKMYIKIKPHGWIYKDDGLELEFGWALINRYDPEEALCMHIKGVDHYWAWFKTHFNQLSKGNYVELFKKQLEEFRIDFLLWIRNPDTAKLPWVGEYYELFKGKFYDFSPEEQQEYEKSLREWDEDQSKVDRITEELNRQRRM